MNKSGKTVTIILVVISILSLVLTVIAVFFFQKESEMRKAAEGSLAQSRLNEAKLQSELKDAKKEVFVLEEKAKEADEKINGLMDDLELAQGVRDELKGENDSLKEALETESQAKDDLRKRLTDEVNKAKEKVATLESSISNEKNVRADLERKIEELKIKSQAQSQPQTMAPKSSEPPKTSDNLPAEKPKSGDSSSSNTQASGQVVPLGKIVVGAENITAGKVLSVDKENDFIVFNLGEKDGIVQGSVMSIYRDHSYLGDVKVSRVQPDMSAADFISPFSSQKVRKNDQVTTKQ